MPYRPEAELKRPDLKGEFLCGHCGKTFCHAASLNRHRLNFHGDDQQCLVCMQQIPHNDTVRRHMQAEHQIPRVFTCGCCNWTFPDKKELHSHNNSMMKTGQPGEAKAIAVSSRPPGSLSQHELRGEERTPRAHKKRSSKSSTPTPPMETDQLMSLLQSFLAAQQQQQPEPLATPTAINANWINHLMAVQPALLPFLQMTSSAASSSASSSETETPETATTSNNNNDTSEAPVLTPEVGDDVAEEENVDSEDVKELLKAVGPDFLSVATEQPTSSGRESGIGSNTPSPVSGSSEAILQQAILKAKKANKRKSVDEICFGLSNKKAA